MRGARTRDGLLAQVPPSIVMSRSSGIALSDSRADLPRTTMLMPAHLRGAKQGDGLTGRQWRREWAKDGAKPPSPADRSTRPLEPIHENPILPCAQPLTGGAQCASLSSGMAPLPHTERTHLADPNANARRAHPSLGGI